MNLQMPFKTVPTIRSENLSKMSVFQVISTRIYGVIFAPKAAERYNKQLEEKYNLPIKISTDKKRQTTYIAYKILF